VVPPLALVVVPPLAVGPALLAPEPSHPDTNAAASNTGPTRR
jgi:hypothetical protein